jgi:hypothetical protein
MVIAIIAAVVAFDLLLVWALVNLGWGDIARKFPAVDPTPDAVTRRFQSMKVGVMNFGFAIHVSVDEAHLHLTPIRPLRWFGARPASVPWERMTVTRRHFSGRYLTVKIGTHSMVGPAWCLELVPDADTETED